MLIPKTFHYVWLGTMPMHPLMIEWQLKMTSLHPDWEVRVWREDLSLTNAFLTSNDELIECRHAPYLAQCPTYAKRSDVWRYEILEQKGGVYLDTDFEPIKNFEPILSDKTAFAGLCETRYGWSDDCPKGSIKLEVGCSIVGCVPHHPWIQELVDGIPNQSAIEPLSLAFPYITESVKKHPEVHCFPTETFYPVTWDKYALGGRRSLRKETLPAGTYAAHRWSSNWFGNGLKPLLTDAASK
jgi:mannosyltransferase OCH1-like enzyme